MARQSEHRLIDYLNFSLEELPNLDEIIFIMQSAGTRHRNAAKDSPR